MSGAIVCRWDEGTRRFVHSARFGDYVAHYQQVASGAWRAEIKSHRDGRTVHLFEDDMLTPRICMALGDIHDVVRDWAGGRP